MRPEAVIALLLAGCARATEPLPSPGATVPLIEEIEETTVGDLDGERVPFGNVWEDEYVKGDGTKVRGLSGVLFVPSGPVRVGAGSVVTVGGRTWAVIEVVKRGDHGVVRLQRGP